MRCKISYVDPRPVSPVAVSRIEESSCAALHLYPVLDYCALHTIDLDDFDCSAHRLASGWPPLAPILQASWRLEIEIVLADLVA